MIVLRQGLETKAMIHHLTSLGVLAAIRVLFPVIWAVTTRTDPIEPSPPTVH